MEWGIKLAGKFLIFACIIYGAGGEPSHQKSL